MTTVRPNQGNRAFLKSVTQRVHDRAEAKWIGPTGFANRAAYDQWLRAMHQIHRSYGLVSARILRDSDLITSEWTRLGALRKDLSLAQASHHKTHQATRSWAWGVQYVLNGSALGAAILLKSGDLQPDWPRGYLVTMATYAKDGGLKRFFDRLDAASLDLTEAWRGATTAFPVASEPEDIAG